MSDPSKENTKIQKAKAGNGAIDSLSLSSIPLSSKTLKSARLVKNSRMETAVELHNDPLSGSLQIHPEHLADTVAGNESDKAIIRALANLDSYDIYSMRSGLKKLGITVEGDSLELSADMKENLHSYAMEFTRPLVEQIFGSGHIDIEVSGGESLQKLLQGSDPAKVRRNLQTITDRTGIPLDEIPSFLQDYSDVFLSVAYYNHSFTELSPDIDRFLLWVRELQGNRDIAASARTMASCKKIESTMRGISGSIRERLQQFHTSFEMFWQDINKRSFDALREQVENNHTSVGSVLCGLVVKMRGWTQEFPDNTVGGPSTRAKFIMSEMEPGLERLKGLENAARQQIGLAKLP